MQTPHQSKWPESQRPSPKWTQGFPVGVRLKLPGALGTGTLATILQGWPMWSSQSIL